MSAKHEVSVTRESESALSELALSPTLTLKQSRTFPISCSPRLSTPMVARRANSRPVGVSSMSYTRIDEALERQNFDRAHVAVPPDAHASVTLQLLDALVPSFVEKPLASTAAEANRLVEDGARGLVRRSVSTRMPFFTLLFASS